MTHNNHNPETKTTRTHTHTQMERRKIFVFFSSKFFFAPKREMTHEKEQKFEISLRWDVVWPFKTCLSEGNGGHSISISRATIKPQQWTYTTRARSLTHSLYLMHCASYTLPYLGTHIKWNSPFAFTMVGTRSHRLFVAQRDYTHLQTIRRHYRAHFSRSTRAAPNGQGEKRRIKDIHALNRSRRFCRSSKVT